MESLSIAVANLPNQIQKLEDRLAQTERNIERLNQNLTKPFPHKERWIHLHARLQEIDAILDKAEEAAVSDGSESESEEESAETWDDGSVAPIPMPDFDRIAQLQQRTVRPDWLQDLIRFVQPGLVENPANSNVIPFPVQKVMDPPVIVQVEYKFTPIKKDKDVLQGSLF